MGSWKRVADDYARLLSPEWRRDKNDFVRRDASGWWLQIVAFNPSRWASEYNPTASLGFLAMSGEVLGGISPQLLNQANRTQRWISATEHAKDLHRKTHWIVDREVVRTLAAKPGIAGVLAEALGTVGDVMVRTPERGPLAEQERTGPTRSIMALHEASAGRPDPVLYYASGSMNLNVRSMTLDGEVMAFVAGPWALGAFVDYLMLASSVSWVSGVEEVERLLPPYSTFKRRLGYWLHRLI